ncbi:heat shock protein [Chrysochromulina tobinii]|uniref:Heat shock protein n=1 Tax=Chrysochromulina tobinii TaxID=1460289 RepID=A0A0M0K922_9EUKA|nr:heat shock protein [Chrysochromulina tobinii]|eukprot:KOO35356.1 heat shock protein [Chrysochromulina sp. CCMP291]
MPGIDKNAYALLTNIQGFDSFSLGPHSSIDEIQRAFHTQSLIWHPDKNPGDTQAVRIYKRMKRSYDILMDPTLRKAHDERMTANACTATSAGRLTIMIFPAVSYGVFNVWELPFLHCNQVIAYRYRPSSDSVFGQGIVQSESTPSAAAHTDAPMAAFVHEWTATNLGVDLIRNAMLYILMGSAVMIAISLVGLVLACLPPSRLRGALMALYLCAGLPSWVFLVFVAVGAVALRDSAAALVTTYWDCLKDLSPTHASSIPHRFTEMEAAAGCCIAAAVLLLVGLLAACRVVGWRHLARHTVGIVSLFRGLVGVSFLGLGIVLKLTSQVEDVLFDWLVIGLGGATLCISLLGVCGSRNESKRLLRVYTLLLFALLSAIFGVAVYLLVDVTDALSSWFDASWAAMATHVCASALSPSCAAAAALDPNEWMNASSWTSSPVITRQEREGAGVPVRSSDMSD